MNYAESLHVVSNDDEGLLRRVGLHTSHAQDVKEQEERAKKRRKMQETATAACGAETVQGGMHYSRLQDFPCQDVAFGYDDHPQLAEGTQRAIEDDTACIAPWTVEDSAAQASSLQEFALSPLETEVLWLREALALSTKREESSLQICKDLRIQVHKAYRMIALNQLRNFP